VHDVTIFTNSGFYCLHVDVKGVIFKTLYFETCLSKVCFQAPNTLLWKWKAKTHKKFSIFSRKWCCVNIPIVSHTVSSCVFYVQHNVQCILYTLHCRLDLVLDEHEFQYIMTFSKVPDLILKRVQLHKISQPHSACLIYNSWCWHSFCGNFQFPLASQSWKSLN